MRTPVDEVVERYLEDAGGDAAKAMRNLASDAMADLLERERRLHCAERLISRGFVRGRMDVATGAPEAPADKNGPAA